MARLRTLYRDGWPMALKYCLASFQADSTASDPLLVKNTRFRSPGAMRGQAVGQLDGLRVRVGPEREVGQLARLPGRGLGDLGPAVADLADEQPGQPVQVALAVLVIDVLALAAHDDRDLARRRRTTSW